jgi:hypothetical protein
VAAIQTLKEMRYANKQYTDQTAYLQAEDLHVSELAIVHETRIDQSLSSILDAMWRTPYRVIDSTQMLGTYQPPQLAGAARVG